MARIDERATTPPQRNYPPTSTRSSSVADILERVLDKGIVITGDIKISLTNVELLTIQIRLIISSVERAQEMGLDWWTTNPNFSSRARQQLPAAQAPEAAPARGASAEPAAPVPRAAPKPSPTRRRAPKARKV
ncbi:gas vesicle protein [Myxococcus stipitatus]|uniref:gas vesicle protein n=1 Tax=Myxococcus stipitatus TaxID=83455 RepID=UPI001F1FC889|nr:gas vesicle protein [Myxococcus stipitatus]MCE9670121.1 gas vesicle protein [Myxococcus stipitatus]